MAFNFLQLRFHYKRHSSRGLALQYFFLVFHPALNPRARFRIVNVPFTAHSCTSYGDGLLGIDRRYVGRLFFIISVAPTTTGIISTSVRFHVVFRSCLRSWYFVSFSLSLSALFRREPCGTVTSMICAFLSCLFQMTMSGLMAPLQ